MKVDLIAHTGLLVRFEEVSPFVDQFDGTAVDTLVEFSGRACYQSWKRPNPATATNEGYLANILKQGHFSVLEHASATFYVQGVSRALTHELIRHRHLSYCLSGDTKVYLDRPNRGNGNSNRQPSQTRTLAVLHEMWQDRRRTYVKTATIRSINPQGHVVHQHIKDVAFSGIKDVYEVTLDNGYKVKSTLDHLFMTDERTGNFTRLEELTVGDEVVVNGRKVELDDLWLQEKVDQGLTTGQIATLAGCSTSFIKKRRRELGIPGSLGSGTLGKVPWNKGAKGTYTLPAWTKERREKTLEAMSRSEHWQSKPETWTNTRTAAGALYGHRRAGGCVMCGTTGVAIELDHIDGDYTNNAPDNIQPLCVPCHKAKHSGTPPMKVYRSKISSIVHVGEEPTYDLEMADYPNFVANGFVVHNSQLSQRFVNEDREDDLVLPPAAEGDEEAITLHTTAQGYAQTIYDQLVRHYTSKGLPRKQAREAARAVLPNQQETKLVVTGNLRAWRDVISRRIDPAADAEIQEFSRRVLAHLKEIAPNSFQDM